MLDLDILEEFGSCTLNLWRKGRASEFLVLESLALMLQPKLASEILITRIFSAEGINIDKQAFGKRLAF